MLGNETIEIYDPQTVLDPDGSVSTSMKLDSSKAVLAATIEGCSVQPFLLADKLQQEDNNSRFFASTTFRVYAPAGETIKYTQWVLWRGDMYEVYGFPGYFYDFEGIADHIEFLIRLRRG